MNSTVVPQLYCPFIKDNGFHIGLWPHIYFLGTIVLVEHILIIYLTQN